MFFRWVNFSWTGLCHLVAIETQCEDRCEGMGHNSSFSRGRWRRTSTIITRRYLWILHLIGLANRLGPFINNNHASVAIGACVPFGIYLAQHSKGPEELICLASCNRSHVDGHSDDRQPKRTLDCVCLTIFFINQSDRQIRRLSGLIALVLGVGVVLYGVEDALTRWTTLIEPDFYVQNGLDTGRLSMYRAALPLVWSAPLVGAGAGGFAEAFATRLDTVFYSAVEQAHNDPLELVIEYDLPYPSFDCAYHHRLGPTLYRYTTSASPGHKRCTCRLSRMRLRHRSLFALGLSTADWRTGSPVCHEYWRARRRE